jgi:hypothetical protein
MAYVIFTANGGDEVDRRELTGPVTIGRAQDADIPVRDILLSRKHCKIEPVGPGQWVVTDLGSKNGTYIGYRQVTRHTLKDGDELRIGRTRVTFKAGAFEPAAPGTKRREIVRPADPTEALAGTVAGFILVEPGEVEREAGAPVPQPRPPEPSAYASEDVYGMLNEIASSSWDSIQEQASRPLVKERPLPRPNGFRPVTVAPRRNRVAFSLQAPVAEPTATSPSTSIETPAAAPPAKVTPPAPRPARWWNVSTKMRQQIALGFITVLATALLVGAWVFAVNGGPRPSAAGTIHKPAARQPAPPRELLDITFPAPSAPIPSPSAAQASLGEPAVPAERSISQLHMPSDAMLKAAAQVALVQFLTVR